MFGKGWSYYRPFGDAIVDGFDLDLEVGPNTGYDHFAWRLRQLMNADTVLTGKEWILTAAPQCPLPDAMLDSALRSTSFDAVFVQFYNNPSCGANTWVLGKNQTNGDGFNFGQWDIWAKTKSRNNKIKVFLTVPMSPEAGNGYVSRTVVGKIIGDIKRYSSLGGFGAWDASVAAQNIGYLAYAKNALNTASIPPVKTPVPAKRDTMPEVHSTPHRHVHRKHRRGLF